jgi:hypothetical protein
MFRGPRFLDLQPVQRAPRTLLEKLILNPAGRNLKDTLIPSGRPIYYCGCGCAPLYGLYPVLSTKSLRGTRARASRTTDSETGRTLAQPA